MAVRPLCPVILTTALALAVSGAGRAEPIPAPEKPLKDYFARGLIQIDLPPLNPTVARTEGKRIVDKGIQVWFPFEQAYVRPNRLVMGMTLYEQRQRMFVQDNTERIWNPDHDYILQRIYKNVDAAQGSPIPAVQMSLASYADLLKTLTTGKLLPPEDLEAMKKANEARIQELRKLREELAAKKDPAVLPQIESTAAEMGRLRDDINQIPMLRAHPHHVVEVENRDLAATLLGRGLMGKESLKLLDQGKTRFWVTKKEGFPLKIQTTGNNGRVAIHMCLTEVKLNDGIHPNEVILGAPPATRQITLTVDLRNQDWETKMEQDMEAALKALEDERLKQKQAEQDARIRARKQAEQTQKRRRK